MSLFDQARQHIKSAAGVAQHAAGAALEAGQTLSAQAQAQVNLRKLQVEQARKTHELGKETYAWHQSGTLVVSGPPPRNVQMLCFQLDDLGEKVEAENLRLEDIKRLAELRAQQNAATADALIIAPESDATVATPADISAASTLANISAPQLPGNAPTQPLPPDDLIS